MREMPILFSTPMVQAILDNRKTMTRRVIKPQPTMHNFGKRESLAWERPLTIPGYTAIGVDRVKETPSYLRCPYGQPGDRLWVRETWTDLRGMGFDRPFSYRADCWNSKYNEEDLDIKRSRTNYGVKWKPSIHMPKIAARIWLEVVSVRVEELQEITEDDVNGEGIACSDCWTQGTPYKNFPHDDICACVNLFHNLWNSINESRGFSWDTNPYVWVVSFRRVE